MNKLKETKLNIGDMKALANFLQLDNIDVISNTRWHDFNISDREENSLYYGHRNLGNFQNCFYKVEDSVYLVYKKEKAVESFLGFLKDEDYEEEICYCINEDYYLEEMKQHFVKQIKLCNIPNLKKEAEDKIIEILMNLWENSFEWKTNGMSEDEKCKLIFENNLFDQEIIDLKAMNYILSHCLDAMGC
jgi:hypothetical protein